MFFELIAVGGVMFWILLFIASIIVITFVENEGGWPGVLVVAGTAVVLLFFGDLRAYMTANPITFWGVVGFLAAYLAIGIVWSTIKWALKLRKLRTKIIEVRDSFVASHKLVKGTSIPSNLYEKWAQAISYHYKLTRYGIRFDPELEAIVPPAYSQNKNLIASWAALWPWSVLWTALRDPFMEVVELLSTLYQKISDKMFAKFTEQDDDTTE